MRRFALLLLLTALPALATGAVLTEIVWTATCTSCGVSDGANPPSNPFIGTYSSISRTTARIDIAWLTPGTIGSKAVTFKVLDSGASYATVCTCTGPACNAAAGIPSSCLCAGNVPGGHRLVVIMTSKGDCVVAPQNIVLNVAQSL